MIWNSCIRVEYWKIKNNKKACRQVHIGKAKNPFQFRVLTVGSLRDNIDKKGFTSYHYNNFIKLYSKG